MGLLPLAALLLVSLSLNLVPVWWGLPTDGDKSWAFDELSPDHHGLRSAGRHRGRYPPLHYDLLRGLYKPVRVAAADGILSLSDVSLRGALQTMGRTLSSLMATATVLLIYLSAGRLMDRPAPLVSAAVVALSAPFVYFAKTINLEAPYLFWFSLALYFFLRLLESHRLRDYLIFAAAMTLSVCTKDQAFALYVLPLVWLILDLDRHRNSGARTLRGVLATILDRRLVWSGVLSLTLFIWIHDLLFGIEDFLHHLAFMRGPGARGWREYPMSWLGQTSMLVQAVEHTAFVMGWPAFTAAILGFTVAAMNRRTEGRLLGLALFPISYYGFFIFVARFHYVRFLLPVALVLALFSGRFFVAVLGLQRFRTLAYVALALTLLGAARRSVSLDLQMVHDSRYAVEDWLKKSGVDPSAVHILGSRSQIRGHGDAPEIPLERVAQRPVSTLRGLDAEYLVVNELEPVNRKQAELVTDLRTGRLNYRPVFEPRYRPWLGNLSYDGLKTNLNSVNPPLTVFRRSLAWGPSDEEIERRLDALDERSPVDHWSALARDIAEIPVLEQRLELSADVVAFGLSSDGWTRGTRRAALLVVNDRPVASELVVAIACGAGPDDLPVTVTLLGRDHRSRLAFEQAGRQRLTLPSVPAGERRLFILFADRDWQAQSGRSRRLGVQVRLLRHRRSKSQDVRTGSDP